MKKMLFLLKDMKSEIIVMDDTLTNENVSKLSKNVGSCIESHGFLKAEANRAALFVEEISLTILEKNVKSMGCILRILLIVSQR